MLLYQQVKVRGEVYSVVNIEDLSHLGTKFFGKKKFTLQRLSDRSRWAYLGRQVAGNSKLSPAK